MHNSETKYNAVMVNEVLSKRRMNNALKLSTISFAIMNHTHTHTQGTHMHIILRTCTLETVCIVEEFQHRWGDLSHSKIHGTHTLAMHSELNRSSRITWKYRNCWFLEKMELNMQSDLLCNVPSLSYIRKYHTMALGHLPQTWLAKKNNCWGLIVLKIFHKRLLSVKTKKIVPGCNINVLSRLTRLLLVL